MRAFQIAIWLLSCSPCSLLSQQPDTFIHEVDSIFSSDKPANSCAFSFQTADNPRTDVFYKGLEDLSIPDEKTLYNLDAVSEVLIGLELAYEVQSSRLSSETYVEDLLPPGTKVNSNLSEMISLFHLATHTSGFSFKNGDFFLRDLPSGAKKIPAISQLIETRILGFNQYRYSNFNTELLIHLIGRAGKTNFFELLEKNVLKGLGMSNTYHNIPAWYKNSQPSESERASDIYSNLRDMNLALTAQLAPPRGRLGKAIELSHKVFSQQEEIQLTIGWKTSPHYPDIYYSESHSCLMMFNKKTRTGFILMSERISPEMSNSLKNAFVKAGRKLKY